MSWQLLQNLERHPLRTFQIPLCVVFRFNSEPLQSVQMADHISCHNHSHMGSQSWIQSKHSRYDHSSRKLAAMIWQPIVGLWGEEELSILIESNLIHLLRSLKFTNHGTSFRIYRIQFGCVGRLKLILMVRYLFNS